ncbi:hypothetical protein [Sphingomonas montana]|uniref:hypothetical protein n=1 Tax=Sphingomonas montana TaxID=1843236 RepID=UPI00101AE845|nr:hypothetical protein [Sphingomonas montana]
MDAAPRRSKDVDKSIDDLKPSVWGHQAAMVRKWEHHLGVRRVDNDRPDVSLDRYLNQGNAVAAGKPLTEHHCMDAWFETKQRQAVGPLTNGVNHAGSRRLNNPT